jgi:hypothetical protein
MNDAVALLAISQLVCLAALVYLYSQLQAVKANQPARKTVSGRVRSMPHPVDVPGARQAARQAYTASTAPTKPRPAAPDLATRMGELGVDVPALARRMQKSEAEVRLLLRRGALGSRELAG